MAIAPRGLLHLWVQQAAPGALAQAFALHIAARRPERQDAQRHGQFRLSGRRGTRRPRHNEGRRDAERRRLPDRTTSLRATSTYFPSPIDQAMVEQAFQGRMTALSQAFAYWLTRRWRR
jgi:hypothetical protein